LEEEKQSLKKNERKLETIFTHIKVIVENLKKLKKQNMISSD